MGHWFKHDSDALADKKLRTLKKRMGFEGIGIWWSFIECLASEKNQKISKTCLEGIEDILGIDSEKLNLFLETCYSIKDEQGTPLLCQDDNNIWSQSLINRQKAYEEEKERNRLAKQKTRAGQSKDILGTSEGQKADASISLSISNSNSESNNKKEESAEAPIIRQGRKKYHDWVYLSDDEYSQAKSFYSQNGLEEKYFEFAIRELDRRLDKKPELRGLNHQKELQATWLIGLVTDQKQKDTKLQKTKDPPKSFKDLQAEREHEERNALREKYKKEDEERERLELLEEQENEKKQNEKTRVDGLLTRTLSQLPKLQAH